MSIANDVKETKLLVAQATLQQVVSLLQKVVANVEGINTLPTTAATLKTDAETLLASVISTHAGM